MIIYPLDKTTFIFESKEVPKYEGEGSYGGLIVRLRFIQKANNYDIINISLGGHRKETYHYDKNSFSFYMNIGFDFSDKMDKLYESLKIKFVEFEILKFNNMTTVNNVITKILYIQIRAKNVGKYLELLNFMSKPNEFDEKSTRELSEFVEELEQINKSLTWEYPFKSSNFTFVSETGSSKADNWEIKFADVTNKEGIYKIKINFCPYLKNYNVALTGLQCNFFDSDICGRFQVQGINFGENEYFRRDKDEMRIILVINENQDPNILNEMLDLLASSNTFDDIQKLRNYISETQKCLNSK